MKNYAYFVALLGLVVLTSCSADSPTAALTSCPPAMADARQLLEWTQSYWAIENGLHYRRDVTLQEDATHTSLTGLAKSLAILNNFLIGLVRKLGFTNLASARRYFDVRIAQQLLFDFY